MSTRSREDGNDLLVSMPYTRQQNELSHNVKRRLPMAANDSDSTSDVGYGKPPRRTRFRKGVSGNPKGRPKGSKNLASIFRKISHEKVQVNGPRGPRYISKL